jgi:hypothetical protein
VYQWFAELQLFQGKDQQGKSEKALRAYNYRLGFFLDFTVQQNLGFLDQIDRNQLLRYVKFLREHENDLDDRGDSRRRKLMGFLLLGIVSDEVVPKP